MDFVFNLSARRTLDLENREKDTTGRSIQNQIFRKREVYDVVRAAFDARTTQNHITMCRSTLAIRCSILRAIIQLWVSRFFRFSLKILALNSLFVNCACLQTYQDYYTAAPFHDAPINYHPHSQHSTATMQHLAGHSEIHNYQYPADRKLHTL